MSPYDGIARIDNVFVEDWEPRYDEYLADEPEYHRIVVAVKRDMDIMGTLSAETFRRILDWKSPRTKGKVDWENYDNYMTTIQKCCRLGVDGDDRLEAISNLQGVGCCVGSTILHFIFPDTYPIFDVRTVEALRHLGANIVLTRSVNTYPLFRDQIIYAQVTLERWTLRQLDRALFAFHALNPQIFGATLSNGPRRPIRYC